MNPALAHVSLAELELALAAWGYKPSHAARVLRAFYATGGAIDDAATTVPPA